ncbi:MAG: hypothetical protein ACTSRT_19800 [Promethearchaeota archaeon]
MEQSKNTHKIKENKYLYVAAISMLLYSILETSDSVAIVLIAFNIIPNLYLGWGVPMIQQLMETQPLSLAPLFWAFTIMRIVSAIGLMKNLLWGFWIGMGSILITMILTMLFLPIGSFELLGCAIIFILLVMGYCRDKPII